MRGEVSHLSAIGVPRFCFEPFVNLSSRLNIPSQVACTVVPSLQMSTVGIVSCNARCLCCSPLVTS